MPTFTQNEQFTVSNFGQDEQFTVSSFNQNEQFTVADTPVEDTNSTLRTHSYGMSPDYHAVLEYYRDASWQDLTNRLVTRTTDGEELPIELSLKYRQPYIAKLYLDNADGLLTPENQSSALNKNAALAYDALLDEGRKVRVKQGIYCYSNQATVARTWTSSHTPVWAALWQLGDQIFGDPTIPGDGNWCKFASIAAGAQVWIKVDLGSAMAVYHGMLSLGSKTITTPQIELPASVQFAYSTDDVAYTDIGEAFAVSKYSDSQTGQRYLAYFTDLGVQARYIRATITNISEENDIIVDEMSVFGGASTTFIYRTTITGLLGDAIDMSSKDPYIQVQFEDVRKKEADNRRNELSLEYKEQRPEQIIYDLLTNHSYWTDGVLGYNLMTDGGFENYGAGWTDSGSDATLSAIIKAYRGFRHAILYNTNAWVQQANRPITAAQQYSLILKVCNLQNYAASIDYHVEIQPYNAAGGALTLQRFPGAGSYSVATSAAYSSRTCTFTAPANSVKCTIKVLNDGPGAGRKDLYFDEFFFYATAGTLSDADAPLAAADIGWAEAANLSGFTITKWQGQQDSILGYINEIAELAGWVFDADGNGVRQFWEPPDSRVTASTYLDFFGNRMVGVPAPRRQKTGQDIRNFLKIVAFEDGNKEVPREYRNTDSISKYGTRYARITEPLIKNQAMSDQLAAALLRDFAFAGQSVQGWILGDFDIDRPAYICTFDEPIRAFLDKTELWRIEAYTTQMVTVGKGRFVGELQCRKYFSSMPAPVANVAATGGSTTIAVTWNASPESDVDTYGIYWASGDDPTLWNFTATTSATNSYTIPGLTNGTAYWIYVTAINIADVPSDKSAIIRCLAGVGNSGSESASWGITGMTAALTDNDPTVDLNLAWTPSLTIDPDYISAELLGPHTANPPTNAMQVAKLTPANAVAEHYYATYNKDRYDGALTYYWRLAIHEVVILDRHYRFGSPLYGNAASAVWPS